MELAVAMEPMIAPLRDVVGEKTAYQLTDLTLQWFVGLAIGQIIFTAMFMVCKPFKNYAGFVAHQVSSVHELIRDHVV